MRNWPGELLLNVIDQGGDISRFNQVVVNLGANGLQCGFKCGITGKDEIYTGGLHAAHGAETGCARQRDRAR